MSTSDLELCQNLPKIRLSSMKIETHLQSSSDSSCREDEVDSCMIKNNNNKNQKLQEEKSTDSNKNKNSNSSSTDDEYCRTPTSVEHKIPEILCCPPAPRKPRRTVSSKRKLDFFEILNREEVDDFFRSSFDLISKRRRCINT